MRVTGHHDLFAVDLWQMPGATYSLECYSTLCKMETETKELSCDNVLHKNVLSNQCSGRYDQMPESVSTSTVAYQLPVMTEMAALSLEIHTRSELKPKTEF